MMKRNILPFSLSRFKRDIAPFLVKIKKDYQEKTSVYVTIYFTKRNSMPFWVSLYHENREWFTIEKEWSRKTVLKSFSRLKLFPAPLNCIKIRLFFECLFIFPNKESLCRIPVNRLIENWRHQRRVKIDGFWEFLKRKPTIRGETEPIWGRNLFI
jgi:hypothetical protein